jgi:4-hydroxybenzoate polyprenyltransferase
MFRDLASILRLHIIAIAVAATLTFGWLFTGRYPVAVSLLVGLDWCLINLLNRISDVREDLANGIRGTGIVAAHPRAFAAAWTALLAASFALGWILCPALTGWRVAVQVIGVGYSYAIVPTPRGLRRFKDLYFLKNGMSAALFVLTCFVYPLVVAPNVHRVGTAAVVLLAAFFVPFEISYEILYDLRDLEGDRLAGVPTYPVVHGPDTARRIIDALLVLATLVLAGGLAAGVVGLREGLMLAAPAVQLAFYRPRFRRGLTTADCIALTNLGTALLLVYLAGTWAWARAGLPADVYLR